MRGARSRRVGGPFRSEGCCRIGTAHHRSVCQLTGSGGWVRTENREQRTENRGYIKPEREAEGWRHERKRRRVTCRPLRSPQKTMFYVCARTSLRLRMAKSCCNKGKHKHVLFRRAVSIQLKIDTNISAETVPNPRPAPVISANHCAGLSKQPPTNPPTKHSSGNAV